MTPTADPNCFIEERGEEAGELEGERVPFVRYRTTEGERWVIRGRCIACGECEVGALNPRLVWTGRPVGEEGACIDPLFGSPERLDVPVRPEIARLPHCTLRGEYLNGD